MKAPQRGLHDVGILHFYICHAPEDEGYDAARLSFASFFLVPYVTVAIDTLRAVAVDADVVPC